MDVTADVLCCKSYQGTAKWTENTKCIRAPENLILFDIYSFEVRGKFRHVRVFNLLSKSAGNRAVHHVLHISKVMPFFRLNNIGLAEAFGNILAEKSHFDLHAVSVRKKYCVNKLRSVVYYIYQHL